MNRDLRQQWLDALRSDEYFQTIGELRRLEAGNHNVRDVYGKHVLHPAPVGHCCLGVLADLCVQQWPDQFEWVDTSVVFPAVRADEDDEPYGALHLTGEREATDGELQAMGELLAISRWEGHLVMMNDGGQPFSTIADYIENNVTADDSPLLFLADAGAHADQA